MSNVPSIVSTPIPGVFEIKCDLPGRWLWDLAQSLPFACFSTGDTETTFRVHGVSADELAVAVAEILNPE